MIAQLLAAALALSPAFAADKPAKRTLAELKAIALEKGEAGKLGKPTAKDLGFPERPIAIKQVWFDQGVSADGQEHVFAAVMDEKFKNELVWTVTKATKSSKGDEISGFTFLVSDKGALLAAASGGGVVGHVKRGPVPLSKARRAFETEKGFWTSESSKYAWSK
jgi:hypothetical protein